MHHLGKSFVGDQPRGVEGQTERGFVGNVVTLKIMLKKLSELILKIDIRAGGHKVTSSQVLVKGGIVSSVKLIDGHLPDWVRPTGAVLSISVALMWQPNNEKL